MALVFTTRSTQSINRTSIIDSGVVYITPIKKNILTIRYMWVEPENDI